MAPDLRLQIHETRLFQSVPPLVIDFGVTTETSTGESGDSMVVEPYQPEIEQNDKRLLTGNRCSDLNKSGKCKVAALLMFFSSEPCCIICLYHPCTP